MVCPHCATPAPGDGPTCRVCGEPQEGESPIAPLEDLEPTRLTPAPQALPSSEPSAACPRCHADVHGERFCEACGHALVAVADDEELPPRRCMECGSPNPADRIVCLGCGMRL